MTAATVTVAASTAHLIPKPYSAGLVGIPFTASIATTSLDDVGDIVELGYIPANVTVVGFIISTASLAASALVYKITLGATDAITGVTTGSGAGSAFWGVSPAPITTTAVTKVQINITTVATTPAAGVFNLTVLCANG